MPNKEIKDLIDEAVKELCSVVPTPKSRAREIILSIHQKSLELALGDINTLEKQEIPYAEHECHLYCCGKCFCQDYDGLVKLSQVRQSIEKLRDNE